MGAQLADPTIAVEQSSYIVVRVGGVEAPAQPTIEIEKGDPTGVRTQFVGSGSQVFRSGNKTQQIHSFRFSVIGVKPGTYSLVAAIEHEGETFGTDPSVLTVRAMTDVEKSVAPEFTIEIEDDEIYLGEMLPLRLVITTSPGTSPEFHNVAPEIESNGFVMQPLRGLFRADSDAAGNDRHFFEGTCEALRAGDLKLGPATYPMQLAVRNRSNGRATRKQYKLSSDPITVKVKPLPSDGKPESFTGSVGRFSLDIQAAPTKLKQGEPISVKLTVAGEGNLPSIDAPSLTGNTQAWKQYDPSRVDSRADERNRRNPMAPKSNSGSVTFTQMIVPLTIEAAIPPFEFSFFDPETGTYRTLRTDPIPIEVSADPNAIASSQPASTGSNPLPEPEPPQAAVPNAPPPFEEMTDILSISDLGENEWVEARRPLTSSKLFWALQAPPAAALLGLAFLGLSRRSNERRGKATWSGTYPPCAEILRSMESGKNTAQELYEQAHHYLEAWEEQNSSAQTAKLDQDLARAVEAIRERHNFLAFGAPQDGDGSGLVARDEQQQVIRTLRSLPANA
jgi:hypothetical protein